MPEVGFFDTKYLENLKRCEATTLDGSPCFKEFLSKVWWVDDAGFWFSAKENLGVL